MPPLIRLRLEKAGGGLRQALLVAIAAGGSIIGLGGTWVSVRALVHAIAAGSA